MVDKRYLVCSFIRISHDGSGMNALLAWMLINPLLFDFPLPLSWPVTPWSWLAVWWLCFLLGAFTWVVFAIRRYDRARLHQLRTRYQEATENLQLLFESNPTPMWTFDVETLAFLTVNQAAIVHYGFSREEFLSLTIVDIRPAEEVSKLYQRIADSSTSAYLKNNWLHQKKDGQVIEVEITSRPFYVSGRPARLVMANDITERRKAESERFISEQSFKALVENSPDVISRIDRNFRYCYVNQALEKVTGQKADHYLGRSLTQFGMEAARLQEVQEKFQRVFDEQIVETDLAIVDTPQGTKYFQSLIVPELDKHGQTVSVLSTQRDITELIEGRHALEQTNQALHDFKFALDKAAIVCITNAKGNITYVNEEFCQVSQYAQQQLLGATHRLLKSDYHARGFYEEMWQTISGGKVWKGDLCNRRKDGSCYWLSCTIVPFMDSSGQPYQYLSIQFDITARKQAEENLVITNAELDNFVYRASHDIRGPLARLMGLCSLGLLEAGQQQALTYFKLLEEETQHLNHVLLRLLSVNTIKHWDVVNEPVQLAGLLEESVRQMNRPADIELVDFRIHQIGQCALVTDPQLLKVILQNLIENSVRFRKEHGQEKPYVHTTISLAADHSAQILVADNGIGISNEIKEKVFQMFFRGTARSEGSGLGLYIARQAVEKLGGSIRLLQWGRLPTVFEIIIPSRPMPATGCRPPETALMLAYG